MVWNWKTPDLPKAAQFDQTRTGAYTLQSILDAYINKSYDNTHLKWDFSGETQAIAKTYEVNAAEIAAYNKTLTAETGKAAPKDKSGVELKKAGDKNVTINNGETISLDKIIDRDTSKDE